MCKGGERPKKARKKKPARAFWVYEQAVGGASPYWDTLAVTTVTASVAEEKALLSSSAPVSGLCSLCLSCRACGQVGALQTMCWDHRLRGQTSLLALSVHKDGDRNTFSAVLTLETSVAR